MSGLLPCETCGSTRPHCPHHPRPRHGFWPRVHLAVACLVADEGVGSRGYDASFENFDGDVVVAAIDRLAARSPTLQAAVDRQWATCRAREHWRTAADRYRGIPIERLERVAATLRSNAGVEQDEVSPQLALAL